MPNKPYRMTSDNVIKENASELEKLRARHITNQERGDFDVSRREMLAPDQNSSRFNYNTYKFDFFAGSQVKIFFGDVWVDDIATIQFNVRQTKEPIYGYASQNYDAVSMGTVIGEGSLTIAFKEVGYLNVIDKLLKKQKQGFVNAINETKRRINNQQEAKLGNELQTTSQLAGIVQPNLTPSLTRESETIEEVLDKLKAVERSPFTNKLINVENNIYKETYKQQDFEDVAELMEDAIWGQKNNIGPKANGIIRADEFDHIFEAGVPVGIFSPKGSDYTDSLNIMLAFGDLNDARAEHTIILLNDIHFTGQAMVITSTGEPIGETFNFFFHDLNKSLNVSALNISPLKLNIGLDDPFTISRLKDIEALRDNVDINVAKLRIEIVSNYDDGKWTAKKPPVKFQSPDQIFNWNKYNKSLTLGLKLHTQEILTEYFIRNQSVFRSERVAVKVDYKGNIINMVLERQGDIDSSTYIVVTPSTNEYQELNLIKREDFFTDAPNFEAELINSQPLQNDGYQNIKTDNTNAIPTGTNLLQLQNQLEKNRLETSKTENQLDEIKSDITSVQEQLAMNQTEIDANGETTIGLNKNVKLQNELDALQNQQKNILTSFNNTSAKTQGIEEEYLNILQQDQTATSEQLNLGVELALKKVDTTTEIVEDLDETLQDIDIYASQINPSTGIKSQIEDLKSEISMEGANTEKLKRLKSLQLQLKESDKEFKSTLDSVIQSQYGSKQSELNQQFDATNKLNVKNNKLLDTLAKRQRDIERINYGQQSQSDLFGSQLNIQNVPGLKTLSQNQFYKSKSVDKTFAKYEDFLVKAGEKYKVDPLFLASIIQAESGGDPNVKSKVGAIGLTQVLPSTGKDLGFTVQELKDPEKSIYAGAKYLNFLKQRPYTQNNPGLVLAAYNAGPGRVKQFKGVPPFKETNQYIYKINYNLQILKKKYPNYPDYYITLKH